MTNKVTFRRAAIAVLAGLAGVLMLATPAGAAGASVTVSPGSIAVGGTVRISGSIPTSGAASCPASNAAILTSTSALFPPDGFGPAVARDASGGFGINFQVPLSTPPGSYNIGLRCGGGNVGVSTTLTVTSQVQKIPTGAPAAGLGGASKGSGSAGWIAGGVIAALVALLLAGTALRRRRRIVS